MTKPVKTALAWKAQLERDGFVVINQVIDSPKVEKLTRAIEATLTVGMGTEPDRRLHGWRHLHRIVPAVRDFAKSGSIRSLVNPILGLNVFVVRSLFFDKTPDANWKVPWHQDLTIAVRERLDVPGFGPWSVKDGVQHVQPPIRVLDRMLTVRLHLDDCDVENGPLQVLPGSHRDGRLSSDAIQAWKIGRIPVSCTVQRGGVVVMRPLLLHASPSAQQTRHRRVIHLEFAAEPLPGGLRWEG